MVFHRKPDQCLFLGLLDFSLLLSAWLAPILPAPDAGAATNSHFGYMGNVQGLGALGYPSWSSAFSNALYFEPFETIGFQWDRPHPGPFNWNIIESQPGVRDFTLADQYVAQAQQRGLQILATIWPFADWDQQYWRSQPGWQRTTGWDGDLPDSRYKPHDLQAYSNFVQALVERYDGDGGADMPGLRYPIGGWEILNEPETSQHPESEAGFFRGSVADYLEVLQVTAGAIRAANPAAVIANGGATGAESSYWQQILTAGGGQCFNLGTWHSLDQPATMNDLGAETWLDLLSPYGIRQIWMTEFGVFIGPRPGGGNNCPTERDQAIRIIQGHANCFAAGADKVFFIMYIQTDDGVIDPNGSRKRAGYYAYQALVSKLDGFTSVTNVLPHNGTSIFAYRFLGDRQPVYCLWANTNLTLGMTLTTNIITQVKITTGVPAADSDVLSAEYKTASNGIAVVNFSTTPIYIEEGAAVAESPQSVSVKSGHAGALSLTAVGTAPLQYQWMKDGVSLGGMTSSVFNLAVAGKDNEGSYVCRVSNMAAGATSAPAFLAVTEPVAPPDAPSAISASQGDYTDRIVVRWSASDGLLNWATGYQLWRALSNDISAATMLAGSAGTLTTNYVDRNIPPLSRYTYWVQATNRVGVAPFSSSASGWCAGISSGVCADYDGDGKADPAVYDEASGTWKVKLSSAGYSMVVTTFNGLGGPGYASVSADYDGDGKADPAVYQEAPGIWIILPSSLGYAAPIVLSQTLGGAGYSGMPSDYDADAKADPGVYHRVNGNWQVLLSSAGYYSVELLGLLGGTGYRAVAADYDGDQKADPAVYGESSGVWTFKISSANYMAITLAQPLGGTDYIPVPADYDGDGFADPAVRSITSAEWIVMFSTGGYAPVYLAITFE